MSSQVSLIHSDALAPAEHACAATAPGGSRLIFIAGACPLDDTGATVGAGDCSAQATRCLDNLVIALREARAGLEDVVSTRVLVASSHRADLVAAWCVVRDAFGAHDVPSTLLGVTVLGYDGQLVEVDAVAVVAP